MKFSLFLAIILSASCVLADNVPVLIARQAGDNGANVFVNSLEALSQDQLKQLIAEQSTPTTTIFVFHQPILQTEHLSCKRSDGVTCFEQISQIQEKIYTPAAVNPFEVLSKMSEKPIKVYVETTGELSQEIKLGSGQVVLVQLREQGHDNDAAYLGKIDRIISGIRAKYSQSGDKALFVWTGEQSAVKHVRKARAAEEPKQQAAAPAIAPTFYQRPSILAYWTSLVLTNVNGNSQVVESTGFDVHNATEGDLTIEITGASLEVHLDVAQQNGYWYVKSASVNGNNAFLPKIIGAPVGFSYKCDPAVSFRVNDTTITGLTFRGLQIQPKFGSADPLLRFGDAYDCVGFTSVGIWAGLFVTLILLVILTTGITWIMDIRTMDRFDDPKGKTITIATSE